MQPTSKIELNDQTFDRLKRTVRTVVTAERQRKGGNQDLPNTLGVKMANRCNLRCAHCYQWNESGYHHFMDRAQQGMDLDISIFEKLLAETRPVKSRLYLWGGEPLAHREIDKILQLLETDPRDTTICTNAYFIEKHIDRLCRISSNLEFLIAVEGFETEHDAIRGKGSFKKVTSQIELLLKLRSEGVFRGKISIHTVISDGMIGRFYELMNFYESKGIDLVLLCFPWYISEETSQEMDQFMQERFSWLVKGCGNHSWDAFKFRISPEKITPLIDDLKRINSRVWKTKLRYQPDLDFDEFDAFVRGKSMTARCATTCRVLNDRVDITPNGQVSACKFFSEFFVGDLNQQSLKEIWRSSNYERIRETLGQKLSPACSKCNVLYLHKHSTPIHI